MTTLMSTHGWLAAAAIAGLALFMLRVAYGYLTSRAFSFGRTEVILLFAALPAAAALILHWGMARQIPYEDKFDGAIIALSASGDGKYLAAADTNGVVKTFDMETLQSIGGKQLSEIGALYLAKTSTGADIVEVVQRDGSIASSGVQLVDDFNATSDEALEYVLSAKFDDDVIVIRKTGQSRAGVERYRIFYTNSLEALEVPGDLTVRPTAIARLPVAEGMPHYVLGLADGRVAIIDLNWPAGRPTPVSATTEGRSDPIALLATTGSGIIAAVDTKGRFDAWQIDRTTFIPQRFDALSGIQATRPRSNVVTVLRGHGDIVNSAELSADGRRIVTASRDGTVRIWDAVLGDELGRLAGHEDQVMSASFSPDGTRIVTASSDSTARLWDVASGKAIGQPMRHDGQVTTARFSPDGNRIVTTSTDGTARLWDGATADPAGPVLPHGGSVVSADFSPDGTRFATASADGTARLWSTSNSAALGQPMAHPAPVIEVSFDATGASLLTVSADNSARQWNASDATAIGDPLRLHGTATTIGLTPIGVRILAMSDGNSLRIWDAAARRTAGVPLVHDDLVTSGNFSSDGSRLVSSSWDSSVRLWDAEGHMLARVTDQATQFSSAKFAPNGDILVTNLDNFEVRIWNANHIANAGCLGCVAIKIGSGGDTVELVDYLGRHQVFSVQTGLKISETTFNPYGQTVAIDSATFLETGPDGTLAMDDGTSRTSLTPESGIITAALKLPDGRIVTGSSDGRLRIRDKTMHDLLGTFDIWRYAGQLVPVLLPIAPPTADEVSLLPDPLPEAFVAAAAFTREQEGGFIITRVMPEATNAGITATQYDAYRSEKNLPQRDLKDMTDSEILEIYFTKTWLAAGCNNLPERLARVHFDTAMNLGVASANEIRTRATVGDIQAQRGVDQLDDVLLRYLDTRRDVIRGRNLSQGIEDAAMRRIEALARDIGVQWRADPATAN